MQHFRWSVLMAIVPVTALAQDGIELMDEHVFVTLMADEFEFRDAGDENELAWDIDLTVGGDLNRFWSRMRGHRGDDVDETELQLLYSRAFLPFWDVQAGVRRDFDPGPSRNWAVVGVQGLAPSFFEVEAHLFMAEGGQTSLRLTGEYELPLSQRLFLTPELSVTGFGRNEPRWGLGSGLGRAEFNVRLRYEVKREIAPYVGIGWHRQFGSTRDSVRLLGRELDDVVFSIGFRGWY